MSALYVSVFYVFVKWGMFCTVSDQAFTFYRGHLSPPPYPYSFEFRSGIVVEIPFKTPGKMKHPCPKPRPSGNRIIDAQGGDYRLSIKPEAGYHLAKTYVLCGKKTTTKVCEVFHGPGLWSHARGVGEQ